MNHSPKKLRLVALAVAAASTLALSACSGDDKATFDSTASQQAGASASSSPGAEGDATATVVEPAKVRTIEVNEEKSFSSKDAALTFTVHKVVINDFYVEAEITLINDGTKKLNAWYGSSGTFAPRLFDDQGRDYPFQVQPGGKGQSVRLKAGEGLNAVIVFAGRVDPQARQLTLDFTELDSNAEAWSLITFDVPVGEN